MTPKQNEGAKQSRQSNPATPQGEAAGPEARREAESLKEKGAATIEEAKAQARDIADMAKDRALNLAETGKERGADQMHNVAEAIRGAAEKLADQAPGAARYVREAAAGLDSMSRALRRRNMDDLIGAVDDFARENPAVFFGGAVLSGFFLARLVKSSGERRMHGAGHPPAVRPQARYSQAPTGPGGVGEAAAMPERPGGTGASTTPTGAGPGSPATRTDLG